METFKHGCPLCGQHIEYTVEYCGKQMQCPSCGNNIVFPALPPGRAAKSSVKASGVPRLQRQASAAPSARTNPALKIIAAVRDFSHWKTVGQCLIPFLIIGVLLYGANLVRTKFSNQGSASSNPVAQADPTAWDHMTELTRADQAVKARVRDVVQAHNILLQYQYQDRSENLKYASSAERDQANRNVQLAQNAVQIAQRNFEAAMQKYQQLGGTVDYRSKLPR